MKYKVIIMNNINQTIYDIYNNVDEFYKYRNLISLDEKLTQNELNKQIQKDKYIILKAVSNNTITSTQTLTDIKKYIQHYNEKTVDKNIYITCILLIYVGTDAESKRANMIKLLNHIRYPKTETLIITPTKLSSSINNYITDLHKLSEHQYRTFKPYTYNLLKTILPNHELVPKYKILTQEEIDELEKHYITKENISKVYEHDPQMVWIGAKPGDVVEYRYLSEITIFGIGYALIISSN